MAGERYSKITIRAEWSAAANIRGDQTEAVSFLLAGAWVTYRRGGNPSIEYAVPDPKDDDVGTAYVVQGLQNLIALLRATIKQRGLSYVVSDVRDLGGATLDPGGPSGVTGQGVAEFDITCGIYQPLYDLDFRYPAVTPSGWTIVEKLSTITPIQATVRIKDALVFGSATGSITIEAGGGAGYGPYTFAWADGATGNPRTKLKAGIYPVTITDGSGASLILKPEVGSDPKLVVQVNTTDTSIALVASGGVGPYTYAWADGPTTIERRGLVVGTYTCLVTDSHGAQVEVVVTLSPYRFYWSQNPITLALDAGDDYRLDPTTKPNLSFLCEVWLEKNYLSGEFEQVGTTLEQPADRDGRTVFQVQVLLAAFLDYHLPAPDASTVQRADPLFRRFFLRHAQQFGDVPEPTASIALERNYVCRGGLNFYEAQARTWFTSYQAAKLPFLTWEPTTKAVLADQPEFLYYMVQGEPGSFRPQICVHFGDGTEQLLAGAVQDDVRDFEVYCLPVGYQALGLATLAQPVTWWEIFVTTEDGATVLSETRRFVLDTRQFPHRRYFLFATSLGGMATYPALGEAQLDVEVTGQETSLTLPPDYDVRLGDTAVQERALRPVVKVAAGVRTKAQLLASHDLLLSRRVLLLRGTRWLPGYIKTKTSTLLDESKLVQVQEFDFYLTAERLYTPDL